MGRPHDQQTTLRITPRLILGMAIMATGVLFTLDNLGLIDAERYLRFWPVIFVLIGLVKLSQSLWSFGAYLWILAGTILLLDSLGIVSASKLFPLFLVALGAYLVVQAATPRRVRIARARRRLSELRGLRNLGPDWDEKEPASTSSEDGVNASAVLGAARRNCVSRNFRGGDLTAVMGGCEVDLRGAAISSGEAVIDVFAFWGGVEIKVPPDWQVVSRGSALLGGFVDKTSSIEGATQRLVVTGLAIMGGVEIKN